MHKLINEFIGTFFLVLIVGMAVVQCPPGFAPIAIGTGLAVLVYMGANISGSHYNPAVTLGILVRGAIGAGEAGAYMASQFIGGIAGAATAKFLVGAEFGTPALAATASVPQALLVEVLFTFALVAVVLNVATTDAASGNSYFGWAIGCTVLVGAYAGGGISGGAFNPAVGLGGNLINGNFGDVWIYMVGPFLGGLLAAVVFKICNPEEKE